MSLAADHRPEAESRSAGPLVALRDLDLTLPATAGPVSILKGLSLDLAGGETASVVGPSGSGKTSLLMVIAGLEQATGGSVEVAGHDLTRLNEDALARFRRDHVGVVFQDFHLVPTMTALENVAVSLEFAGRRDAFPRAAEALEAVGLAHRLDHYPGQLSGGEQQRTALARAIVGEPRLLLADEPTGNLDGETGRQVIALLFELQARVGSTLVLVTHDPLLAERCERQLAMEDGHLQEGPR